MNKKFCLVFLVLVIVSFSDLVSAQDYGSVSGGAQQVLDVITQVLTPFFGALIGPNPSGVGDFDDVEVFWIRVLLLILLFVIINMAVKAVPRLGEQRGISFIIAVAISIIAVRFMSRTELLYGVLLPYGALGITITTLLPFMIFFYFLHATKMGGLGRRLSWGLYGIIFVFLFISRQEDLPTLAKQIYFAGIALVALAFIFDKAIHRYFFMHELNVFYGKAKSSSIAALQAEYMNIINVDTKEAEKRRKDIEANLKRAGGQVP